MLVGRHSDGREERCVVSAGELCSHDKQGLAQRTAEAARRVGLHHSSSARHGSVELCEKYLPKIQPNGLVHEDVIRLLVPLQVPSKRTGRGVQMTYVMTDAVNNVKNPRPLSTAGCSLPPLL